MLSQLGEAGYGKMKMRHVRSPHCTLAHILVFFLCVSTGIGIYPPVGKTWVTFFVYQRHRFLNWYLSELTFDSLKKPDSFWC
jgi:hypothetical protein